MNSNWKTLKENENYEINVNSHEIRNSKSKKIIKPHVNKEGYYYIDLYSNGKRKQYKLHRLLFNNFIEDLGNNEVIDHIDNNRLNNSLENLRKCSRSENSINSKRTTDFMQIDEKTQETLVVLDLTNEVFFFEKLKLFVRKIYKTKFRILPIDYYSQYYQRIQYTTNGKCYRINIAKYLYPKLAENVNFILIHSDQIYFDKANRKFYRFYSKSGIYKELRQYYNSKNSVIIKYNINNKTKHINVYAYLYKNDSIEVQ